MLPLLLPLYVGAVSCSGLALLAVLLVRTEWSALAHAPLVFAAVSVVIVLGELKPIALPGDDDAEEEATVSSCFALALACLAPLGLTAAVQAVGLLAQDARQGKAPYKIAFNIAQYTIALAVTRVVFAALSDRPFLDSSQPFEGADVFPCLVSACVFYLVNSLLTSTVLALVNAQSWLSTVRADLVEHAPTSGVLMSLAPVVAYSAPASPAMVLLLLLPVIAVHRAAVLASVRRYQATHDSLTELPNRVLFQERLRVELEHRAGRAVVLVLDLDHFKEINDTLGHAAGDSVLQEVAARLRGALADLEVPYTVARLGGDEFAVLLPGAGAETLSLVAAAVQARLDEPLLLDDVALDIRTSGGAALLPEHGRDADVLLQRADVALYTAKEERGRIRLYDPELDRHSPLRLGLAAALRAAVLEERVEVHYQAQLDAATGRLVAVEALARWRHKDLGWVSPATFVPLAESTDLIGPLTELVLRKSLRDLPLLTPADGRLLLAVNLSPRLLGDPGLPERVLRLLAAEGHDPSVLQLEVTESTIVPDGARALDVLGRLRAAGIELAVDDFGTGYSSLAQLRRLHVDTLKIDRSFVMGLTHCPEAASDVVFVRSIVELGHNLGLEVVAEGVEDVALWELVRDLGVDVVQGYAISRPMPAAALAAHLAQREAPRAVPAQVARS